MTNFEEFCEGKGIKADEYPRVREVFDEHGQGLVNVFLALPRGVDSKVFFSSLEVSLNIPEESMTSHGTGARKGFYGDLETCSRLQFADVLDRQSAAKSGGKMFALTRIVAHGIETREESSREKNPNDTVGNRIAQGGGALGGIA